MTDLIILIALTNYKLICHEALVQGTYRQMWSYVIVYLRWFEIVSSTYILMGRYNHSLSLDATIMVSKKSSPIGEYVVTIFVTK